MNADEQLVVMLEARVRDFEKKMLAAEKRGTRTYRNLERGSGRATRQMETDMNRAALRTNTALTSISSRVGAVGQALGRGGPMAAGFAAVAAAAAVVDRTVRSVATLGDEARRAGVSIQSFQELKFVADQNRIQVDQLVDGLKELSLRADEFIVTGAGPGAEAFARLGLSAADLSRGLEDPADLMLTIIGRLEDLDDAARIRISDEVFGGSAGERFVELVGRGEYALRETAQRAHEVGAVLEDDVIRRAQEIDAKFSELKATATTTFKAMVVGIAEFGVAVAEQNEKLTDLFRTMDQADALLGGRIADALEEDQDALNTHADTIRQIIAIYSTLGERGDQLASSLYLPIQQLRAYGETGAADALMSVAEQMRQLTTDVRNGEVDAETFENRLSTLSEEARTAFTTLETIDAVEFGGVLSQVSGLVDWLGTAIARARELRASLPGSDGDGTTSGDGRTYGDLPNAPPMPSRFAPRTSSAPPPRPDNLQPTPGSGGGGGSSAQERLTAYEQAVESVTRRVRLLKAEAAGLTAVMQSGEDVGDAFEYARTRAELLVDAIEDGRDITPELQAEIDGLAASLSGVSQGADMAADEMREVIALADEMEDAAIAGAKKMASLFTGIVTGSLTAEEALEKLLLQILEVQMEKLLVNLAVSERAAGGGVFSTLGGLLGFSSGGYTGNGGVGDVAGVVHGKEFVVNAAATRQPGVRSMLEGINAGRMPTSNSGADVNVTVPVSLTVHSGAREERVESSGNGREIDLYITGVVKRGFQKGDFRKELATFGVRKQAVGGA
ncbi:hypothetical protein [Pontivivens nitratireducens]|uniref:hypothetical protein n=1 Tax=Pontivivens nitratireducens TaxID=2758038 RepID=UPI001639B9ED|nr:hypothetical protein [Pontibrevibacter nitratireducens]